jgi:hypothetical protein
MVIHRGGCHCGRVRFEVEAPAALEARSCSCSICSMTAYLHLIVPQDRFRLLTGEDGLETYTFNTGVAQHHFCRNCGIKSFYVPRSNPDGVSVNVRCLESDTIESVTVEQFDGRNWELHAHELAHLSVADAPPTAARPQRALGEKCRPGPRLDHEPPLAVADWGWRYHHLGVPSEEPRAGERYLEEYRMYVSGFDDSPYGVEWMRFEEGSPVSELVRTVPHIAFEVDDLERAIQDKKLLGAPTSPSAGVRVAMILHNGMAVELMEFVKRREM